MGIQDKNTKNSIKSRNYPKSKTLRELSGVPCSGRKTISEKMSEGQCHLKKESKKEMV